MTFKEFYEILWLMVKKHMQNSSGDSQSDQYRHYPLFRRNLKLEELYRKYQDQYLHMRFKKQVSKNQFIWAVAVFLFMLSVPFIVDQLKKNQTYIGQASKTKQSIVFDPEQGGLHGNVLIETDVGVSGKKYIKFGPSVSWIDNSSCPSIPESIDRVTFKSDLSGEGKYYLWSRVMAEDYNNNSFYFQIDGQCPITIGDISVPVDSWIWVSKNGLVNKNIEIDLTRGMHTFSIIGREPNVKIDRIILTVDSNCTPVLLGDNCINNSGSY